MSFADKTFVLGIGAQKAGTSWLRNYLLTREDTYIFPAEMHFFDSKYGPESERRRARLLRKRGETGQNNNDLLDLKLADLEREDDGGSYRTFFEERVPDATRLFGEITPSYALLGESGFRAVRRLFPDTRVIFIMRDPVDRFYSHVRMERDRRRAKGRPQRNPLALLDEFSYFGKSLYQSTINDLERVFSPNTIIYLFYETLFRPETIRDLCGFLDVEYTPADCEGVINAGGPREDIPLEIDETVRTRFEATYAFCRSRFGARLPKNWRLHNDDN